MCACVRVCVCLYMYGHRVVRESTCKFNRFVRDYTQPCFPPYSHDTEDKSTMSLPAGVTGLDPGALSYSDVESDGYIGIYAHYSSGGYVVTLSRNASTAKEQLAQLEQAQWIDMQTRALFVEFTLHNPELDVLVSTHGNWRATLARMNGKGRF